MPDPAHLSPSPAALSLLVNKLGRRAARRAISSSDDAFALLEAHGITQAMVDAVERRLSDLGVTAFCPSLNVAGVTDPSEPSHAFAHLARIPDPPLALFLWGDPTPALKPSVAMVGSRRCSAVGSAVARKMGEELARAGLVVVSGLARGIDAAAHEGALRSGTTGAVLGSGFDQIYPPEHLGLAARIRRSGYILSEYPPGVKPLAFHFPERNRLISGLCQAVVVVEASQRSGSLITARLALEQGRDVMAVPGSVRSPLAQGCHRLIREGAALVESAQDVLDALGLPGIVRQALSPAEDPATFSAQARASGGARHDASPSRRGEASNGNTEDAAILAALDSTPLPLDLIAEHAGFPPDRVAARLLELELSGVVLQVAEGFLRLE